jgi:hypothetical protein
LISGDEDAVFLGEKQEWLAQYAKRKLKVFLSIISFSDTIFSWN